MKFKSFAASSRYDGGDHVIGLATCRLDELLDFAHNAE